MATSTSLYGGLSYLRHHWHMTLSPRRAQMSAHYH